MCGIAGQFDPATVPAAIDRGRLQAMADVIAHRGPDEAGIHIEPHVGLAHRRLSIIDLATGQQPLANEDGTVIVTYNGEIYNHIKLRSQLKHSYKFKTHSDCEVIIPLVRPPP